MWIEANWPTVVSASPCPCCGDVGGMRRHAAYLKYHYESLVEILRVRCGNCNVTHAIMPSFSLPCTSVGTAEVEVFLKARASGMSRSQAARDLMERGLSPDYPRRLEAHLEVAVTRGKALWPGEGVESLRGLAWMASICAEAAERPLLAMNLFALHRGVNALCFCRSSILLFGRTVVRGGVSHEKGTAVARRSSIDSA
jgi:hypothetical protein